MLRKNRIIDILRVIAQGIMMLLLSFFGFILLDWLYPGHFSICDAEQQYLILFILVIIILAFGYLINNLLFLVKGHWAAYRVFAIAFILFLGIAIWSIRSLSTWLAFGTPQATLINLPNDYTIVDIRLFEHGKFLSRVYDLSCDLEDIGEYQWSDDVLILHFPSEPPHELDTVFQIKHDTSLVGQVYTLKLSRSNHGE